MGMSFPQYHITIFFLLFLKGNLLQLPPHPWRWPTDLYFTNCCQHFKISRSSTCTICCYLQLSISKMNSSSSFKSPIKSNHLLCFPFLTIALLPRHRQGHSDCLFSTSVHSTSGCGVGHFYYFYFFTYLKGLRKYLSN